MNRLVRTNDAPLNRRQPGKVLRSCFTRERVLGNPQHTKAEAEQYCQDVFDGAVSSESVELDEETKAHLRDLGYMNKEIE